jgi:hypothetical protein
MNDIWRPGICCGGGEEVRALGRAAKPRLEAAQQQVLGGIRMGRPRGSCGRHRRHPRHRQGGRGLLLEVRSPHRTGRRAARIPLEVTKETGPSPLLPIGRIPGIDSGAGTQHAEKRMLGGVDHNPGMSAPDGQIAGLRICHSAEFINPRVEVGRGSVIIGMAGALIKTVDEVRAIGLVMAGMQRDANDRQSLMPGQRPGRSRLVLTFLRRCGWDRHQAAQKE